MRAAEQLPPRHGEGDRAKRGGGETKFVARPAVLRARQLRKEMSVPERLLWQHLRQRAQGLKFRRQHPIGPYIVDFCCLSARFVVEVDGSAHDAIDRAKFDDQRVTFLKQNGFRVLRIAARHVLADAVGTAEAIVERAGSPHHHPADGPPPRAGEEK